MFRRVLGVVHRSSRRSRLSRSKLRSKSDARSLIEDENLGGYRPIVLYYIEVDSKETVKEPTYDDDAA